ncbi:MAG: hypothetical protein P5702_23920 [Limnospira sp. PMC 1291.21]|uniref:hypothetical protein n=1 Tax=unclassified Limnospira TaxID=2642885 RepID=UPI0028E15E05|nr:hypothetical protein [Limnospira sp. PMC 1291.21]MDT9328339.1 hypothetical protein [Limnospira sp. PMC 1286.21]
MASRGAIAISPGAIAVDADLLELRSYHQPSNLSIIPNPNGLHKDNSISFFWGDFWFFAGNFEPTLNSICEHN